MSSRSKKFRRQVDRRSIVSRIFSSNHEAGRFAAAAIVILAGVACLIRAIAGDASAIDALTMLASAALGFLTGQRFGRSDSGDKGA